MKSRNVWITGCKHQSNNLVIYCLFENLETNEFNIHSLGKSQTGLLGLGEGVQEASHVFQKDRVWYPVEKEEQKKLEEKL